MSQAEADDLAIATLREFGRVPRVWAEAAVKQWPVSPAWSDFEFADWAKTALSALRSRTLTEAPL
jgi:hypothetical protein